MRTKPTLRKKVMILNPNMFSQTDERWRYKKYPKGKYTVGGSGCGLCAVTHVLIEQDKYKNATPLTFWKYMKQYAICDNGTKWVGITNGLKHHGHSDAHQIPCKNSKKAVYAQFDKGNRMGVARVLSGSAPDGTRWTASGHYIAFIDYRVDKNGRHWFYVKDSGGHHRRGWYCVEKSMGTRLQDVWPVKRLTPAPKPKPYVPKKIKVDGVWGKVTTRLTQYVLKISIDGAMGKQTTRAVQMLVGVKADGIWGKQTTKGVQKFLNNKIKADLMVDGVMGKKTIKAWQTWLNTQVK